MPYAAAAAKPSTAALAIQWAEAHPAEMDWICSNMESNNFAQSMAQSIDRWGGLTDNQLAAIRRSLAPRAAPVIVDVAQIEAKFAIARANQVKKPTLRLDTFVFKYAGDEGRNAGAIYVTDTTQQDDEGKALYLGKVLGGKFLRMRACDDEQAARITAAASNVDEAAKAYGQRTGNCCVCGRELTAEESIASFIGPICAGKYAL